MKDIVPPRYDYIDALRGFAILGVVLVHSSQWIAPTSALLLRLSSEGARGVQLFFITSALTLLLSKEFRKEQQKKKTNMAFFLRRFFRIAPAFYLAIIGYTIFYGFSPRYWAPNGVKWWYIFLTFFFLHGWHPETITSVVPGGWSIAVEMTFYLLFPYFFSKLNTIRATLFSLLVSLIILKSSSIVIDFFLLPSYPTTLQYLVSSFAFMFFFSQLPIFLLGLLLYHLIKKYPSADKKTASLLRWLSFFLSLAFLETQTFQNLLPQHFLYGIAFMIFSLSLYYSPNAFFVNRLTLSLGRLSYSIYLIHFLIIDILKKIVSNDLFLKGNLGFFLAFILVLALSMFISCITYNVIEYPGINLGRYIVRRVVGR